MEPRTLIIGTMPYIRNGQTRFFETYFHEFSFSNLAQIYINDIIPDTSICATMFNITDKMVFKRKFNKKTRFRELNYYDENTLYNKAKTPTANVKKSNKGLFFKIFSKIKNCRSPFKHIARNMLWGKRTWQSKQLDEWLERFNPECIVFCFTNDIFLFEIAFYISNKFNIPIVSLIGDDYYFCDRNNNSFFGKRYFNKYKSFVERLFSKNENKYCGFISDKIRLKYTNFFSLYGSTLYLSSQIERKPFSPIGEAPVLSYFGNLGANRFSTIIDIANALKTINPKGIINVFSNCTDKKILNKFSSIQNVVFKGAVPYSDVVLELLKSDINLLVESFDPKSIAITKYSLSTKVSDALASGTNFFVVGDADCGMVGYFIDNNFKNICIERGKIYEDLKEFMNNFSDQMQSYKLAEMTFMKNHSFDKCTQKLPILVKRACGCYDS